jgi:hypothetical protein
MLHDVFTFGLLGQVGVSFTMHDDPTPPDDPTSFSVLDKRVMFCNPAITEKSLPFLRFRVII